MQRRFSGTTRQQVASLYGTDVSYSNIISCLEQEVRSIAASGFNSSTWGADLHVSDNEPLEIGSAAWNRTECTVYHLEKNFAFVIALEVIVLILVLVHVVLELMFLRRASQHFPDLYRLSRLYVRIPSLVLLLFGVRLCDFALGCRGIIIWQIVVVAVLFVCIHVVLMLNKIPSFSGLMPITPKLLGHYVLAILPLILLLLAFSLSFHFFLMDKGAFSTIPYSLIRTLTLMLGDLGYYGTFANDGNPVAYPLLSNFLFIVFMLGIGGFMLTFDNRNSTEKLLGLRKEDDLNHSIAHLNIHLLIDECKPTWRRRFARSQGEVSKKNQSSLLVSIDKFSRDTQRETENILTNQKLATVMSKMRKDIREYFADHKAYSAVGTEVCSPTPTKQKRGNVN